MVYEKLCFSSIRERNVGLLKSRPAVDKLVWTIGFTVEIELRSQIYPGYCTM